MEEDTREPKIAELEDDDIDEEESLTFLTEEVESEEVESESAESTAEETPEKIPTKTITSETIIHGTVHPEISENVQISNSGEDLAE